jgi:hypothetical protein
MSRVSEITIYREFFNNKLHKYKRPMTADGRPEMEKSRNRKIEK